MEQDLGLLGIKGIGLTEKLKRSTKPHRDRKNKRILGRSLVARDVQASLP